MLKLLPNFFFSFPWYFDHLHLPLHSHNSSQIHPHFPSLFFNNPQSPIYAITILNGYRISHWSMVHPVGTISLKKLFLSLPRNHKLSVDLRSRGIHEPLPLLYYSIDLFTLVQAATANVSS